MDFFEGDDAGESTPGNFPRHIPDDCVDYRIYILDPLVSDFERRAELQKILTTADAFNKGLLKGYIWQRESFSLSLVRINSTAQLHKPGNGTSYLHGRTNYGDSVDDEWLIVFLLRELSMQFEKAWIRVTDADGEFLLIEAARALPSWLNPEIADYRIWLNRGRMHIIPQLPALEGESVQSPGFLSLAKALEFLTYSEAKLLHLPEVEEEAFFRIRKYPAHIANHFHQALVLVSRRLAFIVHKCPGAISAAVESFYLRDAISVKPLQSQGRHKPLFAPSDLVTCLIKFTKVGFAQIRGQSFDAPLAWQGVLKIDAGTMRGRSQAELGMKITSGFEMLLSDPKNQDKRIVRELRLILDDIENGEEIIPSDSDITAWGLVEDDDSWLNIDYRDFEKDLAGRHNSVDVGTGYGDGTTKENLRKLVSRFEDFLADDTADLSGTELDDMDNDEDDDSDNNTHNDYDNISTSSEVDNRHDAEDDFTKLMREMLGMSKETMQEIMGSAMKRPQDSAKDKSSGLETMDSAENMEIQKLSEAMEAELKLAGALRLDSTSEQSNISKKLSATQTDDRDAESSEEDEQLDEEYNLIKNMMESVRDQAGNPGPGGNLMSMMELWPHGRERDNNT